MEPKRVLLLALAASAAGLLLPGLWEEAGRYPLPHPAPPDPAYAARKALEILRGNLLIVAGMMYLAFFGKRWLLSGALVWVFLQMGLLSSPFGSGFGWGYTLTTLSFAPLEAVAYYLAFANAYRFVEGVWPGKRALLLPPLVLALGAAVEALVIASFFRAG